MTTERLFVCRHGNQPMTGLAPTQGTEDEAERMAFAEINDMNSGDWFTGAQHPMGFGGEHLRPGAGEW